MHIWFQASCDPVMALRQVKHSGFGTTEFMTNAIQGLSVSKATKASQCTVCSLEDQNNCLLYVMAENELTGAAQSKQ